MPIRATQRIIEKLRDRHGVEMREIEECFLNRDGNFLLDTRAKHRTIPPTYWFIAETNKGRLLKIVFIQDGITWIKSAYEANTVELALYALKK